MSRLLANFCVLGKVLLFLANIKLFIQFYEVVILVFSGVVHILVTYNNRTYEALLFTHLTACERRLSAVLPWPPSGHPRVF